MPKDPEGHREFSSFSHWASEWKAHEDRYVIRRTPYFRQKVVLEGGAISSEGEDDRVRSEYRCALCSANKCQVTRSITHPRSELKSALRELTHIAENHTHSHSLAAAFTARSECRHRVRALPSWESDVKMEYVCETCGDVVNVQGGRQPGDVPMDVVKHDWEHANASSFQDFVYRFTTGARKRTGYGTDDKDAAQRMRLGACTHQDIERLRLWAVRATNNKSAPEEWTVLFVDKPEADVRFFPASRLQRGAHVMRCRPDVVLQHPKEASIVIERKASAYSVPDKGWPNHRAQLWCYGHMDILANERRVFLVSEYWPLPKHPGEYTSGTVVKPIKTFSWDRRDDALDAECMEYFRCFGGKRS